MTMEFGDKNQQGIQNGEYNIKNNLRKQSWSTTENKLEKGNRILLKQNECDE